MTGENPTLSLFDSNIFKSTKPVESLVEMLMCEYVRNNLNCMEHNQKPLKWN